MGYCVDLEYVKGMEFNGKDVDNIMKDIKKWANGKRIIKWVDDKYVKSAETIEELFSELRYELKYNSETNVYAIDYFTGEKLGNDDEIFKCIGKYLTNGEICFLGEDDDYFKIKCKNGIVEVK